MTSYSPVSLRQYIYGYFLLARLNNPVGSLLLFFPCAWGVAAAATNPRDYLYMVLFFIGAFIMHGAGCTLNDILDRSMDAKVERTKNRPLASGLISVKHALLFLSFECLLGLIILSFLAPFAIMLALLAVPIAAIYPLMKRFISFPQLILGLCFNSGALIGYATIAGRIDAPALLLYGAGIFWTLGYDTIYAHQDKRDDLKAGVKSMALLLGKHARLGIGLFYTLQTLCFVGAGITLNTFLQYYIIVGAVWILLIRQIMRVDLETPEACMRAFNANMIIGTLMIVALYL